MITKLLNYFRTPVTDKVSYVEEDNPTEVINEPERFYLGGKVMVLWGDTFMEGTIIEIKSKYYLVDVYWVFGNDHIKVTEGQLYAWND